MQKDTELNQQDPIIIQVKIEQPNTPPVVKSLNKTALIETTIKIIAPLITVAGLLIGVWQFTAQQTYNDKMEFKRKVWEKRLDAYSEMADVMSKIVTEDNQFKKDSLGKKFEQLYWGKLPLFEDSLVEKSLKTFQETLQDSKNNIEDNNNKNLLKKAGYIAVISCQKSIHQSWKELSK
jgi:hypothetical protein